MITLSNYLKILPAFLISLAAFSVIFLNSVSADWPTARFDNHNSAAVLFGITELETIWTSQNHGLIIASPVVDRDGNIYLVSYTKGLVALDKDGNQRWTLNIPVTSGPILDTANNIYFAGGNCSGIIYSFDKNGQQRWQYTVRPDPTPCDTFHAGPIALSKDQTTLYSGVSYPSQTLLAINTDGTIKWQISLNSQGVSSIGVGDDETIYVGAGASGYLFALNPNGTIKWSGFTAGGLTVRVLTPVLDSAGNIYVVASGSNPPTLVSFTPSGSRRWAIQASPITGFTTPPALKDQRLYLTEGANLKAVDTADGTTLWQWNPGYPPSWYLRPPVVDKDGNIYILLGDKLFIVDPNGQTKNTITLGNNLREVVIPQDNLILVTKNYSSGGYVIALGKKQSSKTPLILIPGIGGSELKINEDTVWNQDNGHGGTYNRAYAKDEVIWLNEPEARAAGEDDYFDVLRMKTDGVNSEANLGLTGNVYAGAYQGAINFFDENGYTPNQDLFVFPYDWRKDITTTKTELDNKINQIKTQTGSQKVDIVAHSTGGLVARNYIADATRAQNVRKLFTLGTPYLGAVEFLRFLRFGGCFTKPELQNLPFCVGLAGSEVKDIIQNLTSGYQLAPSQTYFNFYSDEDSSHPYPYRTEVGSLNYLQITNLLTNFGHNTSLFTPAETFHTLDNSLSNTNGVDVTIIAGSGQPTLGQIIELTLTTLNGNVINFKDKRDINGDGTIPLLSASIIDPHKGLFLNGPAQVLYSNQEHGRLVVNGPALSLVKNILNGDNQLPNGISTQPYKLTGHGLSVHSPVNIHVYDVNGNHTGPTLDGDFEANIPSSTYDTLGDAKFIYLPDDGVYDIKFEATDNGSFDFKIRKFENDQNTQTILYNDIPLTTLTKAETAFDTTSSQSPILQMDNDGNGTVDTQVNATSILSGNAVNDLTPPQTEIQLSGTEGLNGWYKSDVTVTLNTQDDEGGSGILKTEYTLDGQAINTYTGPFVISQEGIVKLKVKSTDKAGNEEESKELEIKIDKTAPEADVSFNLETQNLETQGKDNLGSVQVEQLANNEVILTDQAGNTTKLLMKSEEKKEEKETEKEEKKNKIEIKGIIYNEGQLIAFAENEFEVQFELDKKSADVKELKQEIEIEKQIEIEANYNPKKNETKIELKRQKDKKQKEEKAGLIILHLITSKGNLEVKF